MHDGAADLRRSLRAVVWIACAGLAATLIAARRLFLDDPFFGAVPAFPGAVPWSSPFDAIWLALALAALLPIALRPGSPRWAVLWLALFLARAVPDRMLWQPYLYVYAALLAFATAGLASRTGARDREAFDACRLVLIGVYAWSGLHKLNPRFMEVGGGWLLAPFAGWLDVERLAVAGVAAPIVEVGLGLALAWPRARRIAVVGLVGMHGLILLALGPAGRSYNAVVWPWNLAMIGLLVLLFLRRPAGTPWPVRGLAPWLALALFAAAPALDLLRAWPRDFSFRLYTMNEELGYLLLPADARDALPTEAWALATPVPGRADTLSLDIVGWSDRRLGAIIPSERAIYREVARRVCERLDRDREVELLVASRVTWREPEPIITREGCAQLR